MSYHIATSSDLLNSVLAIGAITGGIAYAIGQYVSSRKRGVGDALGIALAEVEAMKGKTERLEKEMVALQAEIHGLKTENATLRDLVKTGGLDSSTILSTIEKAFGNQTERIIQELRKNAR